MSDNPTRTTAQRVFAAEFQDATHTFQPGEGERAPKYQLLPTGGRANRVLAVGTVTEIEDVGTDSEYFQARVVDPTGTFFVYAGQYQPEAAKQLEALEPPAYLAVVGKPKTYETDDGETMVSIRPESISTVEADTRDRWVAETAEQTVQRLRAFVGAAADSDVDDQQASDIQRATSEYGEDISAYKQAAINALEDLDETATADAGEAGDESDESNESADADAAANATA